MLRLNYTLAAKALGIALVGPELARLLAASAMTLWGNEKGVFENYKRIHPLLTKGSKEYGEKQSINGKRFDYMFMAGMSALAYYFITEHPSKLATPILFTSGLALIFVQSCSINYYGSVKPFSEFVKNLFVINTESNSLGKNK